MIIFLLQAAEKETQQKESRKQAKKAAKKATGSGGVTGGKGKSLPQQQKKPAGGGKRSRGQKGQVFFEDDDEEEENKDLNQPKRQKGSFCAFFVSLSFLTRKVKDVQTTENKLRYTLHFGQRTRKQITQRTRSTFIERLLHMYKLGMNCLLHSVLKPASEEGVIGF